VNRSRLRMIALTIGGITLLAGLPVGALHLGRRISWFDIDRVVVTGADLIPADEVVRQSGISTDQSLFDDSAPWLEALRGHPVIEDVRISRRLPSTVEIHIRE
jgi:cell division septal protein FtsQ